MKAIDGNKWIGLDAIDVTSGQRPVRRDKCALSVGSQNIYDGGPSVLLLIEGSGIEGKTIEYEVQIPLQDAKGIAAALIRIAESMGSTA